MLTTAPSPPLRGAFTPPGDKSISHRAALFAALAAGESRIERFLDAGVTRRMLSALTRLEVNWSLDGDVLTISGRGARGLPRRAGLIDCGNSATTMRLLAGALAGAGSGATLDGSEGLRSRPMARIVRPLLQMGAAIEARQGQAPLVIAESDGPALRGGQFELDVASAQVKTCLLLAGLGAAGPVSIFEPGPSRDHSARMLAAMGRRIDRRERETASGELRFETRLEPGTGLSPLHLRLPGDISSAAFLITAALGTPGSAIEVKDVGLNPTRTGLVDALKAMGARIEVRTKGEEGGEPYGDILVRYGPLRGTRITGALVVRMIDEFPAFAVVAGFAQGETVVAQAGELRHKESDRIHNLCTQLQAIGVDVEERPDGFRINGGARPRGGIVDPQGDHRIAMALAAAGPGAEGPVSVIQPDIINESYPGFTETLARLGARLD